MALMSVRNGERTAESILPGSVWNWIVQMCTGEGVPGRECSPRVTLEATFQRGEEVEKMKRQRLGNFTGGLWAHINGLAAGLQQRRG